MNDATIVTSVDLTFGVAAIVVIALMTALTRGLPYLIFGKGDIPPMVEYLGSVLSPAIMVILVLYCLRNVSFTTPPFGGAEICSLLLVTGLQLWRKNIILSIVAGTACYMILIRTIFLL